MFTDENKVLNIVEQLLNDQSYHIEFNGYLTNHVKHVVVALKNLGASPQRIKEYYDTYVKCTPYGYGVESAKPSEHTITQDNWQDWEHIVARALIEEEEHNPKLVYVQRLLWKRFGHRSLFRVAAGNFTVTPKIPKVKKEEGSTR